MTSRSDFTSNTAGVTNESSLSVTNDLKSPVFFFQYFFASRVKATRKSKQVRKINAKILLPRLLRKEFSARGPRRNGGCSAFREVLIALTTDWLVIRGRKMQKNPPVKFPFEKVACFPFLLVLFSFPRGKVGGRGGGGAFILKQSNGHRAGWSGTRWGDRILAHPPATDSFPFLPAYRLNAQLLF